MKLYSRQSAERIIERHTDWIHMLSQRYPIPEACVKAILFNELTEIDFLDILADLAVKGYWLRYSLRKKLGCRDATPILRRGVFGKRDSSTGYAQIFGYVGINAINFAQDRGLWDAAAHEIPPVLRLNPDEPDHLRLVWMRLNKDMRFNLELAALNLLAAAEEMRRNEGMTVKDLQGIFGFSTSQAIYKWQRGTAMPTLDNIVVLAAVFGVKVDDILVYQTAFSIRISA